MDHSGKNMSLSHASFIVTVIGSTPAESDYLEASLCSAGDSLTFEIRRVSRAADVSFPAQAIHAIVFTPTSLAQATSVDVDVIQAATKLGTCRAYLFVCPGASSATSPSLLDDFIQQTPKHDATVVAEQVIGFFRQADDFNHRTTLFAVRDMICLRAYSFLKFLWPVSYVFAALHILNGIAVLAGRGPFPGVLASHYVVQVATFFGIFFIVHCSFVVIRNALFAVRVIKRLDLGFALGAGIFILVAAATARSIIAIDRVISHIIISSILTVCAYSVYMYARRIRAECTSVSHLQTTMADAQRRMEVLNTIGRQPLSSSAFPFFPFRSKSLFISYMHRSPWSSEAAALIHQWASERGLKVFFDQSSIPSGSLWRQYLLRAISECGYFVALIDGDAPATAWVLAESAYAALLRKDIGKPRILLIFRKIESIANIEQNPWRVIYLDVFEFPPTLCPGAAILSADHSELTEETFFQALEVVRPMCLLP